MNQDILGARWKQLRGRTRVWWGKLNKNDVDKIAGKYEILVGVLQEKYSYTRQQAMKQVDKHLASYQNWTKSHRKSMRSR